jgi:hypothetical protein
MVAMVHTRIQRYWSVSPTRGQVAVVSQAPVQEVAMRTREVASVLALLLMSDCSQSGQSQCVQVAQAVNACMTELGREEDSTIERRCASSNACAPTDRQRAISCIIAAPCNESYAATLTACVVDSNCSIDSAPPTAQLPRSSNRTITKVVEAITPEGARLLRLTLYPHSVSIVSF